MHQSPPMTEIAAPPRGGLAAVAFRAMPLIARRDEPAAAAAIDLRKKIAPFGHSRPKRAAPAALPQPLVKAGDRLSPASAKRGIGRRVAFLAVSLILHGAPLLAVWHAPQTRASVGIVAMSVEITLGANEAAGLASSPGEQEAVSPHAKRAANVPDAQSAHAEVTASIQPRQPQAVAVTSADSASGIGRGRSDNSTTYDGLVQAHLARYQQYPAAARRSGTQGVATVSFSIDRDGHVTTARLANGSGNAAIDQEVVAMVLRASPFPRPPDRRDRDFSVPVRFNLR